MQEGNILKNNPASDSMEQLEAMSEILQVFEEMRRMQLMTAARNPILRDCVPGEKRKLLEENWLPCIPPAEG